MNTRDTQKQPESDLNNLSFQLTTAKHQGKAELLPRRKINLHTFKINEQITNSHTGAHALQVDVWTSVFLFKALVQK